MVQPGAAPALPDAGALPPSGVRCEILPVSCSDGRIVVLAQGPAAGLPGWWQELPSRRHPTQVVVDALTREFGAAFDRSRSIVHSTSWRYEDGCLVLSYLAVLPPSCPAPSGFRWQPAPLAGPVAPADGAGRSADPAAIPVRAVLAHALRHLAMLRVSDAEIGAALSGAWHDVLATCTPLPAGLLDHCLPALAS